MMPSQIVSILGGVVQDFCTFTDRLPNDGETIVASAFSMAPGGKGSNTAVAVHRLTRSNPKNQLPPTDEAQEQSTERDFPVHVRMVGAVGADTFGPPLKHNLQDCGVNVDDVRITEGQKTAIANILVDTHTGANRIMQYPGVNHTFKAEDFESVESLGGGVKPDLIVCQLELSREAIEKAIETACREGIEVLLNPSPCDHFPVRFYRNITHLVMNETEAVHLSGINFDNPVGQNEWEGIADHFYGLGVKNFVITLGANGAYYRNEFTDGKVEAEKNCSVVDTSGAG